MNNTLEFTNLSDDELDASFGGSSFEENGKEWGQWFRGKVDCAINAICEAYGNAAASGMSTVWG